MSDILCESSFGRPEPLSTLFICFRTKLFFVIQRMIFPVRSSAEMTWHSALSIFSSGRREGFLRDSSQPVALSLKNKLGTVWAAPPEMPVADARASWRLRLLPPVHQA